MKNKLILSDSIILPFEQLLTFLKKMREFDSEAAKGFIDGLNVSLIFTETSAGQEAIEKTPSIANRANDALQQSRTPTIGWARGELQPQEHYPNATKLSRHRRIGHQTESLIRKCLAEFDELYIDGKAWNEDGLTKKEVEEGQKQQEKFRQWERRAFGGYRY